MKKLFAILGILSALIIVSMIGGCFYFAHRFLSEFIDVSEDTPAADVSYFEDRTNDTASVFGVKFGEKFENVDTGLEGPFAAMARDVRLTIPKPVKWFTQVKGSVSNNKRVSALHFQGALPSELSDEEIAAGVQQLQDLMIAKFGEGCIGDKYYPSTNWYSVLINVSSPARILGKDIERQIHLNVVNKDFEDVD